LIVKSIWLSEGPIAAVRVSLERGPDGVEAARRALLEGFAMLEAGIGDAG
jgi:hypothetical protein